MRRCAAAELASASYVPPAAAAEQWLKLKSFQFAL
jgi:hypothetical protein